MDQCAEFYDIWASKIDNFKGIRDFSFKDNFCKQNEKLSLAGRIVSVISILKSEFIGRNFWIG